MLRSGTLASFLLVFPGLSAASTLQVPGDQPTIAAGIEAAVDGDTVEVAPGTYPEKLDFMGKAILVRGAGRRRSVIDVSGASAGSGRVVTFRNREGRDSILHGFTLTGGSTVQGGGVKCVAASPTISNCEITGNRAFGAELDENGGGGIACVHSSSPLVIDCAIHDNLTREKGGGIYCVSDSSPTLIRCTISRNTAYDEGGGICCYWDYSPVMVECVVSDNQATGRGEFNQGEGGGIACRSSSSDVSNSRIAENYAYFAGGGIWAYDQAAPTLSHCTIRQNIAGERGGESTSGTRPVPS